MPARSADKSFVPTSLRHRLSVRLGVVAALVIAVALIAGCGSSSSSSNSSSSSGGSSSGGSGTVKVAKLSGYGSALVTASGKSVYLLSTDPAGSSKCTGKCAKIWVPVSGTASAGSGVDSSKLSTFKRSDGTTQVLYDKHALYTFTGQGSTSGEGQASFGGVWYLVAPDGSAIKKSSAGGY